MKTKVKHAVAIGLVAVAVINSFAACGKKDTISSSGVSVASSRKTLKFGCQMYSAGGLDPALRPDWAWNSMRYGITESLFKFDDEMNVQPWLAESCKVSKDHRTWTIQLKKDIKFSDGCDMTATKVKESLDRVKEAGPDGSASPENYLEYDAEILADDEANTITIKTKTAYADLTGNLANPVMAIVDAAHIKDWNNGVIGTGPYAVEKFKEQVGYDLSANKHYYKEVPYDKVELLYMDDASAKTMALQSGQVDLVENITNVADIQKMKDDKNYTVDIATGVRCGFSWMNAKGVLGNKTLRKAILMAIDQESICKSNTIGGLYTAGCSVLPSSLDYGYDKLKNPYTYNPDKAKKLLDEAGIKDTDGNGIREIDGKDINLRYVSYDARLLNDFSDAHTQYLKEIGIGVTAEYGSSDDQWSKLAAGEYDFNNNNWMTVPTGDAETYMSNWYSKSTANFCGYKNEKYDALYEAYLGEKDKDKRKDYVTKLQQILIDDAAVLVDGYYNSSMIYSKNVGYAHISAADYYWLTADIVPAE